MSRVKGVRVVVGEAAPSGEGALRTLLDKQGFEIVGQASSVDQLQPVLAAANPDVIVFDVYTSATTVLHARDWAPRAGIVVVWPSAVLASGVDQQVDPTCVDRDLADAVNRAVRTRRVPTTTPLEVPNDVYVFEQIPEADGADTYPLEPAFALSAEAEGVVAITSRRRSEWALALAAASIAFLVVAALALQPGRRPGFIAEPPGSSPLPTQPTGNGGGGSATTRVSPQGSQQTIQLGSLIAVISGTPGGTQAPGGPAKRPTTGPGGGTSGGTGGTTGGAGGSGNPRIGVGNGRGNSGQHGKSGEPHGKSGQLHGKSGSHGHGNGHGNGAGRSAGNNRDAKQNGGNHRKHRH